MFPSFKKLTTRKSDKWHRKSAEEDLSNSESCPSIASLRPGSVALGSDQLTPGDRIHSVNGINTSRMRPEEVSSLLDNVDGDALIDIEYCLPTYASQSSLCVSSKITEVSVERIDGSLGITLRGGSIPEHPHLSRPLIITQVRPNGAAYRTGLIRIGDRLLSIDNYSLTNKTLLEAQEILKQSSLHAVSTLTLEYDVNIMESVKYATGPLLVEIDRNGNEDLGIFLTNYDFESSENGTFVDHILPASTADRCGALNAGDQLLAIDNVSLETNPMTLKDAENRLKAATKIQILPLHAVHRVSSRGYQLGSFGGGNCSPTMSGFSTINSRRSRNTNKYNTYKNHRHSSISKAMEESASNNSYCYANLGVCHSETLNVTLQGDRTKGYGLTITTTEPEDPTKNSDIVISKIIPDTPAYRCGCLQSGDRILSINHRQNLTLQEINALLDLGTDPQSTQITLHVDFDVADTIVPTTGVFTVKLARRSHGLGITITASKSLPEEPFVISEIRRGSVAHRTGSLQNGDRLLAIDNRPLDQMSIEAAFDILQNSCTDIVTLKVEKMEDKIEEAVLDTVVYTVELVRHGGRPLGITIAGSEDCMEPIVLSRLTEGGLAERTGALHVGDKLVAINGENLDRKPLSEAIRLLQTSNDRVQLKIARSLSVSNDEEAINLGRCNYSSPGLTSIDSAVHSWDSNPPEPGDGIDNNVIKDFESVLSDPLNYQESIQSKHDSQVQFYSDMEDIFCPSPLPLPNYSFSNFKYEPMMSNSCYGSPLRTNNNHNNFNESLSEFNVEQNQQQQQGQQQVFHVTLYKDSVYDDYGFSVSDGLYEKGVYINRIRKGGPADMVGVLRPFDRIVQVNDTKTNEFDCCLTVPLIASAGDRIDLVVARNPFIMHSSVHEGLNRNSFTSSNNTITKTL